MPKTFPTISMRLWGAEDCGLVVFHVWCARVGISKTTGWKWRRLGWIETTTIAGQPYVDSEEIKRFKARAKAGEFKEAREIERAA